MTKIQGIQETVELQIGDVDFETDAHIVAAEAIRRTRHARGWKNWVKERGMDKRMTRKYSRRLLVRQEK